jgi:hypothetical protein
MFSVHALYKLIRETVLHEIVPGLTFGLRRKFVDFHQSVPSAAVGAYHDRGVATGRDRDKKR